LIDPLPKSGMRLPEINFGSIGIEATQRYAEAALDDNPIHIDGPAARSAGLNAPVLHGMFMMGLFERVIAAWRSDIRIMRLHATFVRPVFVGSAVVIGGRVAKIAPNDLNADVILRLIVRGGNGDIVCIGEVFGRLPLPDR
jgi:acyl dehydratase